MEIEKLAVSTFRVRSEKGKQFLIDPWISGNPTAIPELKSAAYLKQFDAVLVSHGHLDHADGVPDFHKANPDAPIICNNELGHVFIREGITNVVRLDCGAAAPSIMSPSPWSAQPTAPHMEKRVFRDGTRIIIILENKYTIYYAADTGLMADMEYVIGDYYKPDLAILPVAGVFMMDRSAVYAR
jgi:L-ascorbate metabolism protein UlaG (beta-lactamase superfamily)